MVINESITQSLKNPVRTVEGRVYYYKEGGSTITFRNNNNLKSFTIERIGEEGKFFGYGICTKANIRIRDINREYNPTTAESLRPLYTDRSTNPATSVFVYPKMNITEAHRDENTNELSITCYDAIYKASEHTVEELELPESYTLAQFVSACATLIGASGYTLMGMSGDTVFTNTYTAETANFEGSETIRDALNAVAEATQTIYFINRNSALTFRRLSRDGEIDFLITKSDYFDLESKTNRRLSTISHITEIGEEIPKSITESGSTQFVRDNSFWTLRDDIETLVENALSAVGGLTINQFTCSWRGNYLLEPGDKIGLVTKDDNTAISYLLHDTITYDGSLKEDSEWNYSDDGETASTPTSLGEAVKQTYARVDKVNHEIELVSSRVEGTESALAAIKITTDDITERVSGIAETTEQINENYEALYNEVQTKMTKDDYTILINDVISENGVDKVITKAGFTFDETGLTVDKADSEMTTTITEDGMKVYREGDEVLTANNVGVNATNLHAKTYLIIGNNSRIEDFGSDRTAIFWIGE